MWRQGLNNPKNLNKLEMGVSYTFSGSKLPVGAQKLLASDCDHAGPSGTFIPLQRQTWHTSLDKCHCRFSCSLKVLSVSVQGHNAFLISNCLTLGKEQTDESSVCLVHAFLPWWSISECLCTGVCVSHAFTVYSQPTQYLFFSLVNKLSLWGFP